MTDTLTVEIPADVRDNSETVTDYAFMRHQGPGRGVTSVQTRDNSLRNVEAFPVLRYTLHQWHDVNPDGQRCRFDMIVNRSGHVVYLFHTEYFTRVPCILHEHYYATRYACVTGTGGAPTTAAPYCDECMRVMHRATETEGGTVHMSARLLVGQHD